MSQPKKLEIKGKYIVIGIVALVVIIGITAFLNMNGNQTGKDGMSFTVTQDEKQVATFSIEEIKKMPSVKFHEKIVSSDKGDTQGDYIGVPISYILNKADEQLLKKNDKFIFVAGDGFAAAAKGRELDKKENVILVYAMDGKNLEPFKDGGQGPMRLIIRSDTYGNRSVRFLSGVECK
ncbi:MAG: molybdopterin-dependent oxidoreductase [Anaerovoracaceae bacterium]